MVVTKDIQEKMGCKEKQITYEFKADFDKIYEEVETQMSIKEITICFNKIIKQQKR